MKRHIITLGVFLVLGAVVNIAVAWGCSVFAVDVRRTMANFATPGERHQALKDWAVGQADVMSVRCKGLGIESRLWFGSPEPFGDKELIDMNILLQTLSWQFDFIEPPGRLLLPVTPHPSRLDTCAGWPMLALECSGICVGKQIQPATSQFAITRMIDGKPRPRSLPLAPLWLGFSVNTLLYATMLWLVLAAPFAVRRRRRIKRGVCPACAYPVGASDVCTECGGPVRR